MKKHSFTLWTYHGPSANFEETLTGGDEKVRCKITAKNCVRSNLLPTLDQKRYQSVKFNKLLSKRQLQGMIKQREKTRVTIFRLANTSLHQVYYEDHEITDYLSRYLSRYAVLLWEMMKVMMLMHGSMLPATTNPPPLPPFRHILGISFEVALANEQPREEARLRDGTWIKPCAIVPGAAKISNRWNI